jgi:hypothetical protein
MPPAASVPKCAPEPLTLGQHRLLVQSGIQEVSKPHAQSSEIAIIPDGPRHTLLAYRAPSPPDPPSLSWDEGAGYVCRLSLPAVSKSTCPSPVGRQVQQIVPFCC